MAKLDVFCQSLYTVDFQKQHREKEQHSYYAGRVLQDLQQVYQNQSERHLTVFCIDPIVVYYVN